MAALSTSKALNLSVFSTLNPNQSRFLSKGQQHILFWTVLPGVFWLKSYIFLARLQHISEHIGLTKEKIRSLLEAIQWEET